MFNGRRGRARNFVRPEQNAYAIKFLFDLRRKRDLVVSPSSF